MKLQFSRMEDKYKEVEGKLIQAEAKLIAKASKGAHDNSEVTLIYTKPK